MEEFRNFWHRKTARCQTQRVRARQRRSANLLVTQTDEGSQRTSGAQGVGISVPHVLATETPAERHRGWSLPCLEAIMRRAFVIVSPTSWCWAGSGCRMFRPRRSTGLWRGSTQRRPSRTRCSGGGGPGRCPCQSPRTAVAARVNRGGGEF